MKDPLKKYIQDHREEFDTLEVPEDTFDKIMSRLNESTVSVEKTIPLFSWKKWTAAASIAVIFSIGSYALWNQKESEKPTVAIQEIQKAEDNFVDILNEKNGVKTATIKTTKQENTSKVFAKNNSKHSKRIIGTKSLAQNNNPEIEGDFENTKAIELMADQYSASSRLEGISLIKNFSPSDEKLIRILSEKALSDENTNVRLAAVEALSVHIENPVISKNIRQVFLRQDDPIVQKELITILTEKNPSQLNREVNAKLKELTLDPTTAVFVKDEAYAVLMRY
ncbi:MAG TPA: hypothetical protein VF455_13705 [Chryseobacterium sp.]